MKKDTRLALITLLGTMALAMLFAGPARAAEDGDMFDRSNAEALKNDPGLGRIIRQYHDQQVAISAKTNDAQRAALPKKGFLLRSGDKMICLGDSITSAQGGYVDIMRNMIIAAYPDRKIEVINAGVSGNRVTHLLARVQQDAILQHPSWVTISIGVNDAERGVRLSEYIKNLDELVSELLAAKISVVLLTTTIIVEDLNKPVNKKLIGYNVAIKEVAKAHGLLVVPMHEGFTDAIAKARATDRSLMSGPENDHPNTIGHTVMALTILKSLRFQEPEQ